MELSKAPLLYASLVSLTWLYHRNICETSKKLWQMEGVSINSKCGGLRWERAELVHGTEGPLSWSLEDKV